MPSAWNASVVYQNLADGGTITVSSVSGSAGADQLKDPHVGRKWRGAGNSEWIVVDLGAMMPVDTVALIGCNLTKTAAIRVELSASDPTGQAGEVFDSGAINGLADPRYGQFVSMAPAGVSARYVRIEATDTAIANIQAGRLVAGARNQFEINFSYGWNYRRVDPSRRTESRGGQLFIDKDNSYRVVDMTFDNIPKDQRYGFIEDMDVQNGRSEDVLMILDPTGDLSRDLIWGLIDSEEPIVQPYFDRFSRSYTIRERL